MRPALLLMFGLLAIHPASARPPDKLSSQVEPTTQLLRSYEAALNRGDVDTIVSLYAPDGVFMAQHREPSTGQGSIGPTYREIFGLIDLDIRFEIDEIEVVSPTLAWARTRSAGTVTILENGAQISESNQELFILVRHAPGSGWRIGRYIFSTTKPPQMAP